MISKLRLLLAGIMVFLASGIRADEGMWLPMLIERLNYTDMQKMGLRLTAEELYSINHSSMKDAIIIFGRGCTGEVVSDQGLVFTNHHCGFGAIQANSSVQHDYLTDGFWARSLAEELPNEGLTARFLVRMEDVSAKVLAQLRSEMTEDERSEKVREIARKLEKEARGDVPGNDAVVKGFYNGNEYYLFVYDVFKDVRLVGAPPSSIGKFGGDTDNWMWPRHTGDFAVFRIYAGPDGKPAPYSKDNIPLKPKHFLPVSIKGVAKNDFAMVMGYPGSTDRFLTSFGVKQAIEETNPTVVALREIRLDILREDMAADAAVRIQYASKYAGISNYWKYFIGQTKGLKRLKVYDKKKELEARFTQWVQADPTRQKQYGDALPILEKAYQESGKYAKTRVYYTEGLLRGADIMGMARNMEGLYKELAVKIPDQTKVDEQVKAIRERADAFFKDFHFSTDVKLLAAVLEKFAKDIPPSEYPDMLVTITRKYKGDYSRFAREAYGKSFLTTRQTLDAFLANPKASKLENDMLFRCMNSFYTSYFALNEKLNAAMDQKQKGDRLFVAGLREMEKDRKFYPDANQTLRLTYGKVLDYYPADAVHYDFKTTLAGIMEKEDPSNRDFVIPQRLKDLYKAGDFGPYAQNGELVTCFTTTNDITGGNSGSPVINGNGELIGLAFDGNWEAMSGDIAFETELQRTICVDIRYVLFIIDKYAGAKNLMAELKIIQ